MPKTREERPVRRLIITVLCTIAMAVTLAYYYPPLPSRVVVGSSFKGVGFYYYGQRYQEEFAKFGIVLEQEETSGTSENLKLLGDAKSGVQIGFALSGVSNGDGAPEVLSVGTVYNVALWVFYVLPEPITSLSQLKGRRIAVGPPGSGIRNAGEKVLAAAGVTTANSIFSSLGGQTAFDSLKQGLIDAVWTTAPPELPALQELLRIPNVRMHSFQNADAYARRYPDLVKLDLPQGALNIEENLPSSNASLLGTRVHILVRRDIHPAVLHVLLQTLVKVHGAASIFSRAGEFPSPVDTEYPMAQAAIDFYRDGPSLLHRLVPLPLTVYVQRALVLLATGLPLLYLVLSGEPLLYRWIIRERVRAVYRRLRRVEAEIESAVRFEDLAHVQDVIAEIDSASRAIKIPGRYADSLFTLKVHINLVRGRLATRLAELRQ